jgi:hypothetical protein
MAPRIYILSGPNEDPATLKLTAPNPTAPTKLSSSTSVRIHIRDFKGVPPPETDSKEYFSHPNHNTDLFAIHFFFTPPEVCFFMLLFTTNLRWLYLSPSLASLE